MRAPLALILLLLVAAGARAGSPDWVKTVLADEPPPGRKEHAAVWLLDYGAVHYLPDGKRQETFRQVIRVDTEAGRAAAMARIPYNADTERIIQAHAWVISAGRRKTKSFGPGDFMDQVAMFSDLVWNAERLIVFSPDKIEVGGVIAWEVEIESDPGISDCGWFFQSRGRVEKSFFEVTPMPGGKLVWFASDPRIAAPVAGSVPGSLRWEMEKIAPAPRETPTGFLFEPLHISVRCVSGNNLASKIQTWGEFAGLATDIVEPQIVADAAVARQADDLVKGQPDRWARIRAITEFVQKQITYLSVTLDRDSLAGYRPHLPAEVLRTHLGDCKDKAALMVALLRAAGEKGYLFLLTAMDPKAVEPEWPAADFNHAIVAMPADGSVPASWPQIDGGPLGKLVLFDPTDPGTPLGMLPAPDQGGYGLVVAREAPGLAAIPSETPEENCVTQHLEGKVAADGSLEAKVDETISGSDGAVAHYLHTRLGAEKFSLQLEKRLHDTIPSVGNLKWTEEWDDARSASHFTFQFSAVHYASMAGPTMMLVCPRCWNEWKALADWKRALSGIVSLPAKGIHQEISLQLPEGYSADGLPDNWHEELPFASASVNYRLEGSTLIFHCDVMQRAALHDYDEYVALRNLYQKLDEATRTPVIVEKTPLAQAGKNSSAAAR